MREGSATICSTTLGRDIAGKSALDEGALLARFAAAERIQVLKAATSASDGAIMPIMAPAK